MYKQETWKRVAVLFAGPGMNFVIGLVLIYGIAVVWGLPNLHPPTTAVVGETACVAPEVAKGKLGRRAPGPGPAAQAGIRPGDVVVKVGDTRCPASTRWPPRCASCTAPSRSSSQRDGTHDHHLRRRHAHPALCDQRTGRSGRRPRSAPSGSARRASGPTQYNVLSAVPATFAFTGDLTVELGKSLATIPTKVGALVHAIGGGQRDPETPISVVGASIIGGDTVDHGLWVAFWFFLAQLNFVLGAINLVPLLPFDGGHIAIAVFEKIRNMIRSARGMVAAAPVNYLKLMPATYVVLVLVVGYMLLTVTADLVNPIRLFQ